MTLLSLALCLPMVGCGVATMGGVAQLPQYGAQTPWTHEDFKNDPMNFQFAIVADRTGGMREGVFAGALGKLNLLQPEFVISVGDLIQGYTEDIEVLEKEYEDFDALVESLEMPFFRVVGNHDITNTVMAELYRKRYGQPYYHFRYKDVLFLVVCTEDPPATNIGEVQADYMVRAMEENSDARWTMVFMHKPMFVENAKGELHAGWAKIERALQDRPHTVIGGHWHTYQKRVKHGRAYLLLATTGGGSGLSGIELGQFDHVVWVTMTDEGPRLANLMLDGIHDDNIATPESLKFHNSLLAKVTIESDPLYVDGDSFERAKTTLRLKNDTSYPVAIEGRFEASEPWRLSAKKFETNLAPNSEKEIGLTIATDREMPIDDLPALTLRFKCEYWLSEGKTFRGEKELTLKATRRNVCPRREKPVVVDGKLDEWGKLEFDVNEPAQIRWNAETWTGPEDCSFRFSAAHDDEYLYVAMRVTDDHVSIDPSRQVWGQDGVCVNFYARPSPGRPTKLREGVRSVLSAPAARVEEMKIPDPNEWPEGTKVVCLKTASGYDAEIAVPVAWLNAEQGGAWEEVRLNVSVFDRDVKDKGIHYLWRPHWRLGPSYAGSGVFGRE